MVNGFNINCGCQVKIEMKYKLSWRMLFVFVPLLLISACSSSQVHAPKKFTSNQTVTQKDAVGRLVADPIAKAVVNTLPGERTSVLLADGRSAQLIVGNDYLSASSQKCRSVVVRYADGVDVLDAVCFDGSVWKTVLGKQ